MIIFSIATAISIIALACVTVPALRRALNLHRHGVPRLPRRPKRTLPPGLPLARSSRASVLEIDHMEEQARRLMYDAADLPDPGGKPGEW